MNAARLDCCITKIRQLAVQVAAWLAALMAMFRYRAMSQQMRKLQGDVSTNAQRAGRQSYLSHSGKVDFQPRQSVIVSCAEGGSRAEQKGGKLPVRGPIDFLARPFKRVTCVSVKVFRIFFARIGRSDLEI